MGGIIIYFEFDDFYIELIDNHDLDNIVDLYNSNKLFLVSHTGRESITKEWINNELSTMKDTRFCSLKVVQKSSNTIIGVIDIKTEKETYLSLLMIHNKYRGCGIGTIVYEGLERYIKFLGSKYVRIDVVTNYDKNVLEFWIKKGFKKLENITLNWDKNELPAVVMKKKL